MQNPVFQRNKLIFLTALVTMLITSAAWIGLGGLGYWFMTRDAPPFGVQVDHPDVVTVGDRLILKVNVTNNGDRDLRLAEMDFYEAFLDGFEVMDVKPKPKTTQRIMGLVSNTFSKNLSPGETFSVEIDLLAKEAGVWAGDIDACSPTQNYVTHHASVVVVDPVAP